MAYAIRTPKGKERAVIRALEASGIVGKKFYLGEYVLCREEPPVSRINHLAETMIDVKEISEEEMDRLVFQNWTKRSTSPCCSSLRSCPLA